VGFTDVVEIELSAGKGGNGSSSFARYARDPLAGPDGGDGGRGGNVVLAVKSDLEGLDHLSNTSALRAENGKPGQPGKCYGKDAKDLVIEVPQGTRAICLRSGEEIAQLVSNGERVTILKGGKGGRGNVKFATAAIRTPSKAEPGAEGESRLVELNYKQPAPIAILDSTSSGGKDYYFEFYAHLSGNRVTEFFFYLRKPRRFFWEHSFRKYPMAFLPFQLRKKQSDNVRFPNLSHLYFVQLAVMYLGGLASGDAGAVLRRMLDELEDLEHPNLKNFIAVVGGPEFGEAPPELVGEWQRMCDNHSALNGVDSEIIRLPDEERDGLFDPVLDRIAKIGLTFAKGD